MKAYPLAALRRVRDDVVRRRQAGTAALQHASGAAEVELRREQDRLAVLDEPVAAEELPEPVLRLRALAAVSAHRTLLQAHRASAQAAVAAAAARADAARGRLREAELARGEAVRALRAVETHHSAWQGERARRREAAEERVVEETVAAARWGRAPR